MAKGVNGAAYHASAKIKFDDLSSASDASFSDVSGSDDESDTTTAAAVHVKRSKVLVSVSDPSANLEVSQLISLKCQKIKWFPYVLARLLLRCRNLLSNKCHR